MHFSNAVEFKKRAYSGTSKRPSLSEGPSIEPNHDHENKSFPKTKHSITDNKIYDSDTKSTEDNKLHSKPFSNNITILKRPNTPIDISDRHNANIISPSLPLHKRWELYVKKRNEIFNVSSLTYTNKPKRSTIRLRRFFKSRRLFSKIQISSIISNPHDKRYYAKISFLDRIEYGLLDTGANVSCVGGDLAKQNLSKYPNFTACKSYVKTADGKRQEVLGWIVAKVSFMNKTNNLKFYIIPTITQRLILGIDFWKTFNLLENIIGSSDIVSTSVNGICPPDISTMEIRPELEKCKNHDDTFILFPLKSENNYKMLLNYFQILRHKV